MDILDFLKLDSSRLNADLVVDRMEQDPEHFRMVWDLALEDRPPLSMRASRAIWLFIKKHPYFLEPYLGELVASLKIPGSEGVRRNFINILTIPGIPEKHLGEQFAICLDVAGSQDESIANRANAMTVLYRLSCREPGLKQEVIAVLEAQVPSESPAIEARVRNLLGKLYRETGRRPASIL